MAPDEPPQWGCDFGPDVDNLSVIDRVEPPPDSDNDKVTSAHTNRSTLPTTAEGTHRNAFGPLEWSLFLSVSGIWGASFLFIAIGLDTLHPGVVTMGRVGLGAITLALVPGTRTHIDRADMPRIALLGVTWLALPLTLFPIAQQWIDSSVAGMLNALMPILTAVIASLLLRRLPAGAQLLGLFVGLVGVVLISVPTLGQGDTQILGVILVALATLCYAISGNLSAPLAQKYGSLPVLARVQVIAAVLTIPYGLVGLPHSSWAWGPVAAVAVLGVAGTGLAYVAFGTLIGRAGATRASVVTYVIPVVAVVLGVVIRHEEVASLALVGAALVISGALLTSRREI